VNQKESQYKINLKTGARTILLGKWRNMKWRLPPVSQIDEGVGMTVFLFRKFLKKV
jgi:hypothetical protein